MVQGGTDSRGAVDAGTAVLVDRFGRFAYGHNAPHMFVGWMRGDLSEPAVVI